MQFEKWNKHKVGSITWINKHRNHLHRKLFTDYVINNQNINSILEIGAGELIEAQDIISNRHDIKYTVVDVSNSFLENCRRLNICKCIQSSMDDLPFEDDSFDLVYMSSVIEHTPNLSKTIFEINRVAKSYYIVMFKWKMISGNLESNFSKKKKYFSTLFNLPMMLNKLESLSQDIQVFVASKEGNEYDFDDYKKQFIKDNDEWRNGDRLIIKGDFK